MAVQAQLSRRNVADLTGQTCTTKHMSSKRGETAGMIRGYKTQNNYMNWLTITRCLDKGVRTAGVTFADQSLVTLRSTST